MLPFPFLSPFAVGQPGGRLKWARRSWAQLCREPEGPGQPVGTAPRRRLLGMLRRGHVSPQPPPADQLFFSPPLLTPLPAPGILRSPGESGGGWQRGPERGEGFRGWWGPPSTPGWPPLPLDGSMSPPRDMPRACRPPPPPSRQPGRREGAGEWIKKKLKKRAKVSVFLCQSPP